MKIAYARALRDEELRSHLDRGDTVIFTDAVPDWHDVERQIERMGFGELYAVSIARKPHGTASQAHTRVSPLRPQQAV